MNMHNRDQFENSPQDLTEKQLIEYLWYLEKNRGLLVAAFTKDLIAIAMQWIDKKNIWKRYFSPDAIINTIKIKS